MTTKATKTKAKTSAAAELQEIPVNDVIPTPDNPRKPPQPTDPAVIDLAASIKAHGLLHPIVVRKHPTQEGKWDLRCGARRLAAHLAIKAKTILAVVRDLDDAHAREVTAMENLHREDLTPLEEGKSIDMLLRVTARPDVKALASRLGRSLSWIYRRASLAMLNPLWEELYLTEGSTISGWSAAHLEMVSRLRIDVQRKLFDQIKPAKMTILSGMTVTELDKFLHNYFTSLSGADSRFLELSPACGTCPHNTARQPELFEGSDDATCVNRECYESKFNKWISEQYAAAAQMHSGKLVLISQRHWVNDEKKLLAELGADTESEILKSWEYEIVDATATGSRPAFIVNADPSDAEFWKPHVWIKLRADDSGDVDDDDDDSVDGDSGERRQRELSPYDAHNQSLREMMAPIPDQVRARTFDDIRGFSHITAILGLLVSSTDCDNGRVNGGVAAIFELLALDPDLEWKTSWEFVSILADKISEEVARWELSELQFLDKLCMAFVQAEAADDVTDSFQYHIRQERIRPTLKALEVIGLVDPSVTPPILDHMDRTPTRD